MSLSEWIHDVDERVFVPKLWNTRRFYESALAIGVLDTQAIANAMTLIEFADAYATRRGLDFDVISDRVLRGVLQESARRRQMRQTKWVIRLRLRGLRFMLSARFHKALSRVFAVCAVRRSTCTPASLPDTTTATVDTGRGVNPVQKSMPASVTNGKVTWIARCASDDEND